MTVFLDGNTILDREMLHDTLATGLCLPHGMGGIWTLSMTA